MDTKRGAEVYQAYRKKTSEVLQTNEVRMLRNKIVELEMENKILKKLLDEK